MLLVQTLLLVVAVVGTLVLVEPLLVTVLVDDDSGIVAVAVIGKVVVTGVLVTVEAMVLGLGLTAVTFSVVAA